MRLEDVNWSELNHLANQYLDVLQTQMGAGGRLRKMIEAELIKAGLYLEIIKKTISTRTGKEVTSRKVKPIDLPEVDKSISVVTWTEDDKSKTIPAEDMRKYLKLKDKNLSESDLFFEFKKKYTDAQMEPKAIKVPEPDSYSKWKLQEEKVIGSTEQHDAYQILDTHHQTLEKERTILLKKSKALFEGLRLWQWCLRVKGLNEVAGMTFAGFINPLKSPTIANLWSYCGLAPGQKSKQRGEQGRSNPLVKGRMWVVATNVIRATDEYYYNIYLIKKAYYKQRPDLLALKETKIKGWDGKIDAMAKRILMKLLISHAFDLITGQDNVSKHRNPIPIKPEDPTDFQKVFDEYKNRHTLLLVKLDHKWNKGEDYRDRYWEYLNHAEIDLEQLEDVENDK